MLPISIGLTIDTFGMTAFYIQIVFCCFFIKKYVIDETKNFKAYLLDNEEARVSDWDVRLIPSLGSLGESYYF